MELSKDKIIELQQNRDPYLMIDHVTDCEPGKYAKGYKDLNDEWFFKVHWPSDPNMPGMLQVEALVQMSSMAIVTIKRNSGKILYLVKADKLQFKKKIIPGDRLELNTNILSFKRGIATCTGEGLVNNELACKANFTLILPDYIKQFSK